MKKTASFLLCIFTLFVAACATELTSTGSRIKVANKEEVKGYEYVGVVEASSTLTGVMKESGFRNALNEAMNKAAALGATHIVLDERSKPRYWATSIIVRAEAYKEKK